MHKSGKPVKRYIQIIADGASFLVIKAIRLYQRTFSPDHGPTAHNPIIGCRYYPSCSEYTVRAIQERGLFTGTALGAWRILRCNPLSPGGVDESYKKKQ